MSGVDEKKLGSLVEHLEDFCPPVIRYGAAEFVPDMTAPQDPLIHELVFSLMLWESSLTHAIRGMGAIREELTDYNELRVCFPSEIAAIIGTRYPQSQHRCERIATVLNTIFQREQCLTLAHLIEMPKRDARAYLSSIHGVPGFVAARITLIALGGHAFPIDGLLMKYLTQSGVLTGSGSPDEHMSRMERAVRANDSRRIYGMIEYWADNKRNKSSTLDSLVTADSPRESSKDESKASS